MDREKREKILFYTAGIISCGVINAFAVPGIISIVNGMINSGVTPVGIFNTVILGGFVATQDFYAVKAIGRGISTIFDKMKKKREKSDFIEKVDSELEPNDESKDGSKELDQRFMGEPYPPKIERNADGMKRNQRIDQMRDSLDDVEK